MQRIARIGLLAALGAAVCVILPREANTLKYSEFPRFHRQEAQAAAARGGFADMILTNGQIYTMDPAHPWATAVAIRGETIIGVEYLAAPTGSASAAPGTQQPGSPDALKNFRNRTTRVIDLHGQFAMPG